MYALQTRDPTIWAKGYAFHCTSKDIDVMTLKKLSVSIYFHR